MKIFATIARWTHPGHALGMKAFLWITAGTLLFDQISKLLVDLFLKTPSEEFPRVVVLIPGLLQFIYRTNTGAAFSIMTGHPILLSLISTVVSVGLIIWAWRLKPGESGLRLSLGLIFGGALGNLIDRVWLHEVRDFIDAHWWERYHYPTFNIADSAICIGIFLLFMASFQSAPTPVADSRKPALPAKKTSESR